MALFRKGGNLCFRGESPWDKIRPAEGNLIGIPYHCYPFFDLPEKIQALWEQESGDNLVVDGIEYKYIIYNPFSKTLYVFKNIWNAKNALVYEGIKVCDNSQSSGYESFDEILIGGGRTD